MAQQESKSTSESIRQGLRIEPPAAGGVFPWLARRLPLLQLVRTANAFLNMQVRVDPKATGPKLEISDTNAVLLLPGSPVNARGSSGSGSVPFSGAGAPAAGTLSAAFAYVTSPTPSLYVDMTAKALYVCTTAGTNATSVWAQISSSGSVVFTKFTITALNGDYVTATPSGGGAAVKIAKAEELRTSVSSETIDGVPITYSSQTDNTRLATDNASNSEIQYMTPRYVAGGSVWASQAASNTGVAAVDAQAIKWIEMLPHRQWGGLN